MDDQTRRLVMVGASLVVFPLAMYTCWPEKRSIVQVPSVASAEKPVPEVKAKLEYMDLRPPKPGNVVNATITGRASEIYATAREKFREVKKDYDTAAVNIHTNIGDIFENRSQFSKFVDPISEAVVDGGRKTYEYFKDWALSYWLEEEDDDSLEQVQMEEKKMKEAYPNYFRAPGSID